LGQALESAEAEGEAWQVTAAIRLLALTGCRRGEIEALKWDDVDVVGRCLRLSDSKTGKSVRPIGAAVVTELNRLKRTSPHVFPGRGRDGHFVGLPKAWLRIVANAAKLEEDYPGAAALVEITPHGLRHAYASVAADLGMTEITIAALIGHSAATVTGRYIHHVDSTLVAAADRVSARIAAALEGRQGSGGGGVSERVTD
jgi:integrase